MGQQDVKPMAHHAPMNVLESKHYVKNMMACVSREWLTTTTSSALESWFNADDEDDSVCSDYACNSFGICSCNATHDDYEHNNTYGIVDESVCLLMASFKNRTSMQARKAWSGENGQLERLADITNADPTIFRTTPSYTPEVGMTVKPLYFSNCSRQGLNPIQVQME
jgi:hypothetical protein